MKQTVVQFFQLAILVVLVGENLSTQIDSFFHSCSGKTRSKGYRTYLPRCYFHTVSELRKQDYLGPQYHCFGLQRRRSQGTQWAPSTRDTL